MAEADSWRNYAFPLTTGLTDGLLTSLTFGAARVFAAHEPVTASITCRLAAAAALSAAFVFFIADYARLRLELVNAERHLSLRTRGKLAASRLGRSVFWESLRGMTVSGVSSFFGAAFPLFFAVLLPGTRWLSIAASIGALGLLGLSLGILLYGGLIRWSLALVLLGGFLAWVGQWLHVV